MSSHDAFPVDPTGSTGPDMRVYLDVLQRRRWLVIGGFLAVLVAGIVATELMKPVYQTRAKLLVPTGTPSVSVLDANNPIAAMLAAAAPSTLSAQVEVLRSHGFKREAMEKAGLEPRPAAGAPVVTVQPFPESSSIEITVEGRDPRAIAKLANAMIDLHLEQMEEAGSAGLKQTTEFVRKARVKSAEDLAAAQRKLLAFRRSHRIVELNTEKEAQAQEFVALQATRNEIASEIAATRAQISELRQRLAHEPLDLVQEGFKDNPRRARLESRLEELQVQRIDLLQEYRPTSRTIQDLNKKIADVQRQVRAEPEALRVRTHAPNPQRPPLVARLMELENDLQGHQATYHAAQSQLASRQGVVDNIGPWEIQESRLTQERDAAQTAYNTFSEQLRDLETRSSARLTTARAIDRAAVPGRPIRPKKAKYLAMAAMVGLFLGAGMAFMKEHLDDRVQTPADVEAVAVLPTLGYIPHVPPAQERLVAALPAGSYLTEAYRALHLSLDLAEPAGRRARRLLVTSASPAEGKTTTAANLATAMALDGKDVVLVDVDFRRPGISRLLHLRNEPGLCEVLKGESSLVEALQTADVGNLRVLTAGASPENPAALLSADAFTALLEQLDEQVDVIVLDTPPCTLVADALVIAPRTDGVMLVVQVGETRRGAVGYAMELLMRARAPVVGVIHNNVKRSQSAYSYRHRRDAQYYYAAERAQRAAHHENGAANGRMVPNGSLVASSSAADEAPGERRA